MKYYNNYDKEGEGEESGEKRPAIARIKRALLPTKGATEPKHIIPGDRSCDHKFRCAACLIACLNEIKELNSI
jgi:hypothetical protein